jgi:hypothetical protein
MIEKDLADRVTILRIERGAERHADVAAEPA